MKSDEIALLLALASVPAGQHAYVRDLVGQLGIPEKRAAYICQKWADKGWYNYGVNVLAGWLEPRGREEADKLR